MLSNPDLVLCFLVGLLIASGLVAIYSVTLHYGWEKSFSPEISFFKKHLVRTAIGTIILLCATYFPYPLFRKLALNKLILKKFTLIDCIIFVSILILIITLITGKKVASARRWILFFQPIELIKIFLVIWLSAYFAKSYESFNNTGSSRTRKSAKNHLTPLLIIGIIILLTLCQPAIGTSIIIGISSLIMVGLSEFKIRYLILGVIASLILFFATILTVPYAQKRIKEHLLNSYQQYQAIIAVGSGGLFGKGLGEGKQKLYFLPKAHTDFIFSSIAEEVGFWGSLGLFTLFFLLFNRVVKISFYMNDYFDKMLLVGLITLISIYFFVHLSVNLALIPTTGQPLPFISYGGSALISNLLAIGIILNITRYSPKICIESLKFAPKYKKYEL
ncbi:MAG: FtsW/RodA/SpoVE family cell cycle protein [candidate division WOR-3 bacterium]